MSTPYPRLAGPLGGVHPALVNRRIHDLLLAGLAALIALLLALGIAVEVPKPSPVLAVAVAVGALGLVVLMVSTRYDVTLTLLVLYLGLLDGPIKLLSASQVASGIRDAMIVAIGLGILVRLMVSKKSLRLPPMSSWVLAFTVVVLIQAANPSTGGLLKVVGGFRQQLEWVPLFFFGYMIVRSKDSFRKLFLVLGVIALANGVVGTYQSRLSPAQLASWGPGYGSRVTGSGALSGRTYSVEGEARPRPPALGPDSGFGGSVGVMAVPGLLALLSVGRVRRRWAVPLLLAGALLGVATAASRSSVVIAVIALLAYAGLSIAAGLRVTRPLAGLLVVIALAAGVGSVLVSTEGKGIFARQETVTSVSSAESKGGEAKVRHLSQIPTDIANAPFGVGLGTYGAAAGFGGKQKVEIEGRGVSGESAYNLVALELGLPGLLLWVGLSLNVILLALRRLRRIADVELRLYLVAVFAVFVAFTALGFAGPTLAVSPSGAYLWFGLGIAAYWLAGPGLAASRATVGSGAR